ncbi:MAG: MFS transporter [Corynebacterium sp.]|nr:MFS transporter [Corynebacterium sp.]
MSIRTASPTPTRPQQLRDAWPALIGICLTMLVEMVDNSILNVAIPVIGRELHSTATGLQWITSAYSLCFGGLLMIGGTVGDKFGRKRVLTIGLSFFALFSLGVLLVNSTGELIAIRALTGAAAALIAPLNISLLFRLFEDAKLRQRSMGIVITVSMIGFAIGPTLSGLAIEHMHWHWLLLVNAPVSAIALVAVIIGIPGDKAEDLRSGTVDYLGGILSATGLASLLYALTLGADQGWDTSRTWVMIILGLILLGLFIWRERSIPDPMLNLDFFKNPVISGSTLMQISSNLVMAGIMFATAQLYQYAWGWSPMKAGIANLPFVIGMLAAGTFADDITEKHGLRKACSIGIASMLISLALWYIGVGNGYLLCAIGSLFLTVGMRFVVTAAAVALMGELPEDFTSMGSALNDTVQEVGSAIGVAIIGTVMAIVIGNELPTGAWSAAAQAAFVSSQHWALGIIGLIVVITSAIGLSVLGKVKAPTETQNA